ncbi:MAG TPA: hypothetical protein VIZ43_23515 [Trebonia sp.]
MARLTPHGGAPPALPGGGPALAGPHGRYAVAAALVYRRLSLEVLITVAWLVCHHLAARRQGRTPARRAVASCEMPPASRGATY